MLTGMQLGLEIMKTFMRLGQMVSVNLRLKGICCHFSQIKKKKKIFFVF